MLQGIGTIVGAFAVLVAARLGKSTFDSWRLQKVTERHLEQAERILTAAYKARRALQYVRGAMMWGHELSAAEEILKGALWWQNQEERRRKRLVTVQAYYERLKRTKAEQDGLNDCLPMARALFGEELEKSIDKLVHQFWIVQVNVESYGDDDSGNDPEFTKQIRRAMYDVSAREGEKNEVSDAINDAMAIIEKTCLPVLRIGSAEKSDTRTYQRAGKAAA